MATKSELPTTSQLLDKIFNKKSDYQNLIKKLKKTHKNEKNYKFMNDFEVPDCSRKDDVVYQEYRALKLQREQLLEDLQEKQEQQQQREQEEREMLKNSDKNNNCEKSKSSKRKKSTTLQETLKKYANLKAPDCARPITRSYSRASKELDARRQQKEAENLLHLSQKFTAKTLPKTTYKPNLIKSKAKKLKSQFLTAEQGGEFKFVEVDRQRQKIKKEKIQKMIKERDLVNKKLANSFRAIAPPRTFTSDAYKEKMKEIQEYRKIAKYVRIDMNLKESRWPFSNLYDSKGKIIKKKE